MHVFENEFLQPYLEFEGRFVAHLHSPLRYISMQRERINVICIQRAYKSIKEIRRAVDKWSFHIIILDIESNILECQGELSKAVGILIIFSPSCIVVV